MKLVDTIKMMSSPVYQERFRAEFMQLDIRIKALSNVIEKYNKLSQHFENLNTNFILPPSP